MYLCGDYLGLEGLEIALEEAPQADHRFVRTCALVMWPAVDSSQHDPCRIPRDIRDDHALVFSDLHILQCMCQSGFPFEILFLLTKS